MEPYICNNGDYYLLINHQEVEALKNNLLEEKLMEEGGKITNKIARLNLNSFKKDKITLTLHYNYKADKSWENIAIAELTLNQEGYTELFYSGKVVQGMLNRDLYIKMDMLVA